MSRRYWLPIVAVVGLILAGQQPANAQGSQGGTTKAQAAPHNQTPPSVPPALQDSLNRIGTALEAANNKQTPKDETERAKQDLGAQLVMATSADRMFYVGLAECIITFIGVMLVLATLIYTKRAAHAARDSVNVAQRMLTEVERPTLFPSEIRYFSHNKDAVIGITLKNYGRTAAVMDLVHSTISIVVTENQDIRAAQERTEDFPLNDMLGDKEKLPEIIIFPDPPISEFSADIDAEKLTLTVLLNVSYRALTGDAYDLWVSYVWSVGENRFIRESHSEQKNSKFRIPRKPETGEIEAIKRHLERYWEGIV